MQTNHESEIFIKEGEIYIEVYMVDFMDLNYLLMTHKQNHKIKNRNKNTHTHTLKNNKEEKHTCNNMDGGLDKTFYYKQNQLK